LAAVLSREKSWQPSLSGSRKVRLSRDDNAALSEWQREYLRLGWLEIDEPWKLEREVVRALKPALNRSHARGHPHVDTVGTLRDEFRRRARSTADRSRSD